MRRLVIGCGLLLLGSANAASQGWQPLVDRPSVRHAMTYDPVRDRVVMFTQTTQEPRVYEWDGHSWLATYLDIGPTSSTRKPRLCYDTARRETVLLYDGKTHAYDGSSWRLLASGSPGRLDGSDNVSAYDEQRQVFVYYDPLAGVTFEWDGHQWRSIAAGLFSPTVACIGYDPVRRQVIAFVHGVVGGAFAYDGTAWNGIPGASLPATFPGREMAVCTDPVRNRLLVYGGVSGYAQNHDTLWEWDGNRWTSLASGPPRRRAAIARHAGSGRLILYGGDDSRYVFPETWGYDTSFQVLEEAPLLSLAVTDPVRNRLVGVSWWQPVGQQHTFEWDGLRWTRMSGPHATMTSLVYDESHGVVVGIENNFSLPVLRTWFWSGGAWQLQQPQVDPPWQINQALCQDPVRRVLVMFGFHGTWEWDGAAWTRRTPIHSPARAPWSAEQTSVFDPNTGVVRLIVGTASGTEEWEWDGNDWSQATTTGVPQVSLSKLVLDPRTGKVLLLGTQAGGGGATWERDGNSWRVIAGLPPGLATTTLDPSAGVLRSWSPGIWSALHADPATTAPYGSGCASGNVPYLAGLGRPTPLGDDLRLDLGRAPANSPAALYASLATGSVPLGGGCTQLLGVLVPDSGPVTSPAGTASFPVPVPDQLSLVGLDVYWQAVALEAGGPLLGIAALSNGVRVHVGH